MAFELLLGLALAIAGFWDLGGPMVWWDEGWTLSVARTWVERGHYGRLLDGQFAPPGLEAAFTVTGPIALNLDQNVPIAYDPLVANPDYLVVGRIGRTWWLYNPALAHFRLISDDGEYTIYERVRP